jgi:hypothetical protein
VILTEEQRERRKARSRRKQREYQQAYRERQREAQVREENRHGGLTVEQWDEVFTLNMVIPVIGRPILQPGPNTSSSMGNSAGSPISLKLKNCREECRRRHPPISAS